MKNRVTGDLSKRARIKRLWHSGALAFDGQRFRLVRYAAEPTCDNCMGQTPGPRCGSPVKQNPRCALKSARTVPSPLWGEG